MRSPNGVDKARFTLIIEVLSKFVPSISLYDHHVFLNVVGGLQVCVGQGDRITAGHFFASKNKKQNGQQVTLGLVSLLL